MKGKLIDRLRPDGEPYLDPILYEWNLMVVFSAGVLLSIGWMLLSVGVAGVGGLLMVLGLIHLMLVPDESPVQTT